VTRIGVLLGATCLGAQLRPVATGMQCSVGRYGATASMLDVLQTTAPAFR
jgi:hypothetical protein